ncbi:hypothetical protein TWF718_009983 [Orbilia javanica]|uniref:CFEM domain-containing protein n=1 Tax=Orbilia javanica TaxID=47235 RepID=A0AAN8N0K1_9PEZI
MSPLRFLVAAALLADIPKTLAQKATTWTLTNLDSYSAGRACMRDCLYYIGNRNGCDYTDNCLCRIDLQPQLTGYLSTCISTSCGYTRDISSGVSIYQSYCSGKADEPEPVVTPVATQEIIETTIIERITQGITATTTETSLATVVVNAVTTITSFTGTTTIRVPSSLTRIEYQTFTAVFNSTDTLKQTLEMWGVGGEKGLTLQGKLAVGMGVGMGVFLVAFLVTLCCCLSRRSEVMRRNRVPGLGGNDGWPDGTMGSKN